MKAFKLISCMILACLTLTLACSCALDEKAYKATDEKYFTFTEVDGGYAVSVKDAANIPNDVIIPKTHDGKEIVAIADGAFYDCDNLKSITIPETVKKIGASAFSSCATLKKVEMLNGVETIGDYAFYYCVDLFNIELPESLKTIGKSSFEGTSLSDVDLLKNVVSVGERAFGDCAKLNSVYVGMSVEIIGEGAFDGVDKHVVFKVADDNSYYTVAEGKIVKK